MKKIHIMMILVIFLIGVSGCSSNKKILVGNHVINSGSSGVSVRTSEIEREKVKEIQKVLKNVEATKKPKDLKRNADAFFSIAANDENKQNIWLYIWFIDEDTAVIRRGSDNYFVLSKKQTQKVKAALSK
ncbi:hypothetical protein [Bacillus sp. AK031]